MQRFNEAVELGDTVTGFAFDMVDVDRLFDALIDNDHELIAQELLNAGAPLGYFNKLQHSSDWLNHANPALLKASKDALERLEASQPPKGGATDTVCKVLRRVIAQVEGEL